MSSLFSTVRGCAAFLLLLLNSVFWCSLLFICASVKLLLPFTAVRRLIDPVLNAIATSWIACNTGWMRLTQRTRWDVQGVDTLQRDGWYMVLCNHQSWVDILVLQRALNRRVPMLKFFLKQQLLYVPMMGLAWWALDFPFLRRHGRAALAKNPALAQQDRDATRRACEKFALVPTSVMSFPEGTRFTAAKHQGQRSPYRHLLKPKAGALAMSLDAMGTKFRSVIDATIVYPQGTPTFWEFLCGRTQCVVVRVRELPIPQELFGGDYAGDSAHRARFHQWLEALWTEKDAQISALLGPAAATRRSAGASDAALATPAADR
ncbi:acyltransferase [Ideonella sp. BN130291]|uniref:acyltransferase n=1 Tax=Ideonella sp. BN130291 TaxID=3112940 RepID=UPI002E26D3D9|nr:acyltransferase [Ideonella sp. BN130291]